MKPHGSKQQGFGPTGCSLRFSFTRLVENSSSLISMLYTMLGSFLYIPIHFRNSLNLSQHKETMTCKYHPIVSKKYG